MTIIDLEPTDTGTFQLPEPVTRVIYTQTEETAVLSVAEGTCDLSAYRTQRPFRRPDATGEHPVYAPSTIGVVEPFQPPLPGDPPPPLPPSPVPPPGPGWNERVGIWPVTPGPRHALAGHASPVRPTRVQSRAWRRELSARDRRARAASLTLLLVLAGVVVALWAVTR